jgi:hypothetical protein
VSPPTSSARSAAGPALELQGLARAKADPDGAIAQFEGMLFAGALEPLSRALGVLGDVLTDAVATAVARGQRDEFYQHLRALAGAQQKDVKTP